MSKRVPPFIAEQYEGGAHGFRSNKRRLVRDLQKLTDEFQRGAAYFPEDGSKDVSAIWQAVRRLKVKLSVKVWGR